MLKLIFLTLGLFCQLTLASGGYSHGGGGAESDPLSLHLDGSNSPTAAIDWGGQNLTNIGTFSANTVNATSLSLSGLLGSRALVIDALGNIISSITTDSEIGQLTGLSLAQTVQQQLDARLLVVNDLSDVASALNARANIGLGLLDSVQFSNLNLSGILNSKALFIDGLGNIASSITTNVELAQLTGIGLGSTVQQQLDGKLTTINNLSELTATAATARTNIGLGVADSPQFTNLTLSGPTASSALFINALGVVSASAVTSTELAQLVGISLGSTVQQQLDARLQTVNNLSELTATAATARTNIGLGAADSPAFTGVSLSGEITSRNLILNSFGVVKSGGDLLDGDQIDGDAIDIDFIPSFYVRDSSPAEAPDLTSVAAHLKGIDDGLAAISDESFTDITTRVNNTPFVIRSVTLAEGDVVEITLNCVAIRTDGTDGSKGMTREIKGGFRRAAGGGATSLGSAVTVISLADTPQAYSTDFNTNVNDVDLEVQGANSQTANFRCKTRVNRGT